MLRRNEVATLVMILMVIVFTAIKQPRFLGVDSINGVLLWIPLLAIAGMGQMLVIVTRGIDVSIGSIVAVAGMVVGMTFKSHPSMNVGVGLVEGLALGLVLGSVNAAAIAWGKVPPIVTTLGTLSAYRGLTFIVSGGHQIDSNDLPDALTKLSLEGPLKVGGVVIPWVLISSLLVAAITAFFISRTRTGRDIYAYGGNPEAARLRGIPVTRTVFLVYALSGAMAGLVGVLYASRYGFVNPATVGQGMELSVIAAVVIGGTKVNGGSGTVGGVLLGCLLLGVIGQALTVLGISETWQGLVYGLVILIALLTGKVFQGAKA